MQNVSMRYTQWFNWRHKKCGHLFQGRYKAVMVDADSYLLELVAYIHLNPVRARMIERPEKYRWSSHRAYLGKEKLPWLMPVLVLSQFSGKAGKACEMFAEFVAERIAEGRRGEFHGEKSLDSRLFGNDGFVEEILVQAESLPVQKPDVLAVMDAVTRLCRISAGQLASPGQGRMASEARALAAWATRELSSGTLAELAPMLKRKPASLSCALARLENRLEEDSALAEKVSNLRQYLQQVQICKA
jgi:hypothetical protein